MPEDFYQLPNQHADAEVDHVRNEMLCHIANELHRLNSFLAQATGSTNADPNEDAQ